MPPRGVKKSSKRGRQYEQFKTSERELGVSESRAEQIAARTVNACISRASTAVGVGRAGRRSRELHMQAHQASRRRRADLHEVTQLIYEPQATPGMLVGRGTNPPHERLPDVTVIVHVYQQGIPVAPHP
jgi:hypothetical protein